MSFDPFANFPAFEFQDRDGHWHKRHAGDMRPDLSMAYTVCLGCGNLLTEPRERSTGLHERCRSAYWLDKKVVEEEEGEAGRGVAQGQASSLIAYLRSHPPPGGRTILGRDFMTGPASVGHYHEPHDRVPGLCACGCGQRATTTHPGLRTEGGA